MSAWKNIKCPGCGKPNDRYDLRKRSGICIFCGYRMVSNLNSFLGNNEDLRPNGLRPNGSLKPELSIHK